MLDTAAGGIGFEIPEAVGGAGVEAESAMDAAGVVLVGRSLAKDEGDRHADVCLVYIIKQLEELVGGVGVRRAFGGSVDCGGVR